MRLLIAGNVLCDPQSVNTQMATLCCVVVRQDEELRSNRYIYIAESPDMITIDSQIRPQLCHSRIYVRGVNKQSDLSCVSMDFIYLGASYISPYEQALSYQDRMKRSLACINNCSLEQLEEATMYALARVKRILPADTIEKLSPS